MLTTEQCKVIADLFNYRNPDCRIDGFRVFVGSDFIGSLTKHNHVRVQRQPHKGLTIDRDGFIKDDPGRW